MFVVFIFRNLIYTPNVTLYETFVSMFVNEISQDFKPRRNPIV